MDELLIVGVDETEVKVGAKGHLSVDTREAALYAAQKGDAYTIVGAADTGAVTSDFLWLHNNDPRDLIIYKIKMYTPTLDLIISIKTGVTGSNTGGTVLSPVNVKAGGPGANVTCYQEDGDLALTGGTTVDTLYLDKDFVGEQVWEYPSGIILPFNTGLVYYVNIDPTADISTTTYFYFAEPK